MGTFKTKLHGLIEQDDTEGLLKLLSHKKSDIRLSAFLALSEKKDDAIIRELKKHLEDPDPRLRSVARLRFGEFGGEESVSNIKSIIRFGTKKDKIEALKLLSKESLKEHPEISGILMVAIKDKALLVKAQAIRTIGELKDAYYINHLIECLNDKQTNIRLNAVKALGEIRDEKAVSPLLKSLVDISDDVNKAALEAFRKLGKKDIIDDAHFIMLIKRMEGSKSSRIETIQEIVKGKVKNGTMLLTMACADEFKEVRLEAVKGLRKLEDKSVVGKLKQMLDDPYYDVRLEAVKALGHVLESGSLEYLEKAMNDSNKHVRDEARKIYESLKK